MLMLMVWYVTSARSLEKTIGKQDKVESINIDLKDKLITINFYENQKLEEKI